jgi:hypothetical protein
MQKALDLHLLAKIIIVLSDKVPSHVYGQEAYNPYLDALQLMVLFYDSFTFLLKLVK